MGQNDSKLNVVESPDKLDESKGRVSGSFKQTKQASAFG